MASSKHLYGKPCKQRQGGYRGARVISIDVAQRGEGGIGETRAHTNAKKHRSAMYHPRVWDDPISARPAANTSALSVSTRLPPIC